MSAFAATFCYCRLVVGSRATTAVIVDDRQGKKQKLLSRVSCRIRNVLAAHQRESTSSSWPDKIIGVSRLILVLIGGGGSPSLQ